MTPETRNTVARALVLASITLGAYVAYAHAVSWRRAAEYRATPVEISFASKATLDAEFPAEDQGGLTHTLESGGLVVRGTCSAPGAAVTLRGRPTRLSSARARVKVRVTGGAPIDVMAGVTTDGAAPERELRFGLSVTGDTAEPRTVGDLLAHGARAEGDRVLARAPEASFSVRAPAAEADAGAGIGGAHELTFGIEPDLANVSSAIDGRILRTAPAGWASGERVRPTFVVRCRDASPEPVQVWIGEIAWEPLLRDIFTRDLDDHFTGAIFDTVWRVSRAEPEILDTRIALGHGLDLEANARALFGIVPALTLVSPRFRAEPFQATLDGEIKHLKQGAVVIGVANPYVGTPFFRMLDFGVFEKDGRLVPFASGHFQTDGQAAFRTYERTVRDLPPAKDARIALELRFDPATRKARGLMNGAVVFEDPIALQPYEDTLFHVAVNGDGPAASAAVHVDRVTFTREHRIP